MTAIKSLPTQSDISTNGSLTWFNSLGFGHDNTPPIDYAGDYWAEYQRRDATDIGRELTQARVDLVQRHTRRAPLDIGIGAGAFVMASGGFGYDVNQIAVQWLKDNGKFIDPYQSHVGCLTFWDSLEHIPDPIALLRRVPIGGFVFVSLPIFDSMDHCLKSKHYKPGEHLWYFTNQGFVEYMSRAGFALFEMTNIESIIGRDSVVSFAFNKCR